MSVTGPYGRLLIIYPDRSKVEVPLQQASLVVGSDPGCGLVLAGSQVLPQHAHLEWRQGALHLAALGTNAAMWVNQQATVQHALEQGDVVRLGDVTMVYHKPGPAVPAPSPAQLVGSSTPPSTGATPNLTRALTRGQLTLGRDPSNDVVLSHPQVSRFHARLVRVKDQWWLADLGSTNGTFLNGQRLSTSRPIQPGEHVRISEYGFVLEGNALVHVSAEGYARLDAVGLTRVLPDGQVLLHDISLSIHPKEFVAVVGGSGAGKSTLLGALSGFRPADQGSVWINGASYYDNLDAFRSSLGYVPQDDIIHTELTAEQALRYAAALRMPEDTSLQERETRVDEVLSDLHLLERRAVPVHKLSGGQRKRVSIGVELLTRPRLFFLDEPTSGLDPGMEAEMMKVFRTLADQGHTLVLITHATRSITLCDKIVFLARGGRLAFFGTPAEALSYFQASDFADIYLKVEHDKTPEEWDACYRASPYFHRYVEQPGRDALAQRTPTARPASQDSSAPKRLSTSWRQFKVLVSRNLQILFRDRVNLGILLLQAPLLAAVLLLITVPEVFEPYQASRLHEPGYLDSVSKMVARGKIIVFLLTFFSLLCGVVGSVRELIKELPIYRRERAVNLGILPYVLAKGLVLASVSALQTAVFVAIIFSQVRPPPGNEDFATWVYAVLFVTNLAGIALGLAVSAAVNNQNTAIATLPLVLLSQIVLSGALIPFRQESLKMLSNLTILKFGFEALGKLTRLWRILPQGQGGALESLSKTAQEYREQFDVLLPGHLEVLLGFVVFFLVLACVLQLRRDHVRT